MPPYIVPLIYGLICFMWMCVAISMVAEAPNPRDNLTWARLMAAILFLPGTVLAGLFIIIGVVTGELWDWLDKPIRKDW